MKSRMGVTQFSRWFLIAVVLSVVSACAVNRETASVDPSANLGARKTLHVVKLVNDDRGVNIDIADNLRRRGYRVTTDEAKSTNVDGLVTYNDKWMWDITMYLLELTVTFRDPVSEFPLATGDSFHTSLTRKSQKEMVDEVIKNIFDQEKK